MVVDICRIRAELATYHAILGDQTNDVKMAEEQYNLSEIHRKRCIDLLRGRGKDSSHDAALSELNHCTLLRSWAALL